MRKVEFIICFDDCKWISEIEYYDETMMTVEEQNSLLEDYIEEINNKDSENYQHKNVVHVSIFEDIEVDEQEEKKVRETVYWRKKYKEKGS